MDITAATYHEHFLIGQITAELKIADPKLDTRGMKEIRKVVIAYYSAMLANRTDDDKMIAVIKHDIKRLRGEL